MTTTNEHVNRAQSPVVYPLRAFLDLSTGCLCKQTREWLEKMDWQNEGPCGGPTAYGWFMYAHDDNTCEPSPEHAPQGEYPADLWACMKKANEMGADYIMFDCDSDAGTSAALGLTLYED